MHPWQSLFCLYQGRLASVISIANNGECCLSFRGRVGSVNTRHNSNDCNLIATQIVICIVFVVTTVVLLPSVVHVIDHSPRLSQACSVDSRRNDNSIFEELSVQGTDMIAEVDFGADITGELRVVVGCLLQWQRCFRALHLSWLFGLADCLLVLYDTVIIHSVAC